MKTYCDAFTASNATVLMMDKMCMSDIRWSTCKRLKIYKPTKLTLTAMFI